MKLLALPFGFDVLYRLKLENSDRVDDNEVLFESLNYETTLIAVNYHCPFKTLVAVSQFHIRY